MPNIPPADDGPETNPQLLSILIPMRDEAPMLDFLFERLEPVLDDLDLNYEILCINDGSTDGTLDGLLRHARRNPRIRVVDLSRNFGKEAAMTAGIDHAAGDAVVPIDADLQDPPELISTFVEKWREGYEVVYGVRADRPGDGLAKRVSARLFYRLFNRVADLPIPHDTGDFRLMDRAVIQALRRLPERNRFMKGLFAWVGFRQIGVTYSHADRVAGQTKWKPWRLWNYAIDGLTAFSTWPLRVWTYVGVAIAVLAISYASVIVASVMIYGRDVPGYASLIVGMLFLGGVQLIGLGVIGEYLGRIYQETKQRPTYVVRSLYGPPQDGAKAEELGTAEPASPPRAVPAP